MADEHRELPNQHAERDASSDDRMTPSLRKFVHVCSYLCEGVCPYVGKITCNNSGIKNTRNVTQYWNGRDVNTKLDARMGQSWSKESLNADPATLFRNSILLTGFYFMTASATIFSLFTFLFRHVL